MRLPGREVMSAAVICAIVAVAVPEVWSGFRSRRRREVISSHLPDAIDLLVVCLEAGLAMNAAFQRVAQYQHSTCRPLSEELLRTNRQILAGKPRAEALRSLADRCGVSDLKSIIATVIQAEELGISIARTLRVQAEALRVKRRQRAQERIVKTPIKLIFPLLFFVFPALFIVILGPAVIQVMRQFLPSVGG